MNYSSHSQYKRNDTNNNFNINGLGRPNIEQVDISKLENTSKYKKTESSVNTSYAAAVLQQVDTTNKPKPKKENDDAPKVSDYERNSINSMTQGELLLFVFDLLLKRLVKAKLALSVGNSKFEKYKEKTKHKNLEIAINRQQYNDQREKCFEQFNEYIDGADDALNHLKLSLDRTVEISKNLEQLYEHFIFVLIRAKSGRDADLIDYVRQQVEELRQCFAVAAGRTLAKPKTLEAADASKVVSKVKGLDTEAPREPEDMEGRRMY